MSSNVARTMGVIGRQRKALNTWRARIAYYGATILSFLGGIYWGLAIASPAAPSARLLLFLGIGVTPQLLGWAALLLPGQAGFFLTAMGLLALLIADRGAVKSGMAPGWFLDLRWPLSIAAAMALLLGGFSSGL